MVISNRGTDIPNQRMVIPNRGTVILKQGTVIPKRGTVISNQGTITPNEGAVIANPGIVIPNPLRITVPRFQMSGGRAFFEFCSRKKGEIYNSKNMEVLDLCLGIGCLRSYILLLVPLR